MSAIHVGPVTSDRQGNCNNKLLQFPCLSDYSLLCKCIRSCKPMLLLISSVFIYACEMWLCFCCLKAPAVVRANLANHILVSHTTSSVAVMVRPPLVAHAQGMPNFYVDFLCLLKCSLARDIMVLLCGLKITRSRYCCMLVCGVGTLVCNVIES